LGSCYFLNKILNKKVFKYLMASKNMKSKKGAEMTIGTIIVIILALVVLVVLIYGFSTGWSNLWQNILGYGGGTVNVQTVVDSCSLACTTQATYDYCQKTRTVVMDTTKTGSKSMTCKQLEAQNVGLSCSNLDCASVGVGVKGICSGNPNPRCSDRNNQGKDSCDGANGIVGCKWTPQPGNDANLGTCALDTTLKCAAYTNNQDACTKLAGCSFNLTP
jgi:hypothetical protein